MYTAMAKSVSFFHFSESLNLSTSIFTIFLNFEPVRKRKFKQIAGNRRREINTLKRKQDF